MGEPRRDGGCCLCLWCCLCLRIAQWSGRWRVKWRVFCAVPLCGTATATSSTAASPAWSRSSCCPCQQLPCFRWQRTGPSWYRTYLQKLACWSKSGGAWSWRHERLADLKCATNLLFWTIFFNGGMFHQKETSSRHDHFSILGPPSTCYDSLEKICVFTHSMTQTQVKLGDPQRKRTGACGPPWVGGAENDQKDEVVNFDHVLFVSDQVFDHSHVPTVHYDERRRGPHHSKRNDCICVWILGNCPNNLRKRVGCRCEARQSASHKKECHDGRTEDRHGRERQDRWVSQRGSWCW